MRSILSGALSCTVRVNGHRHRIKPTVDIMMRVMDDLEDESISQTDRAKLACWRLYRFPRPRDAVAALDAAFKLLDEPSPYRVIDKRQTLSLTQDAALICAAFRQLYGIDLPRESRRMDWRYFNALLSGITSDTVIGGIMDIRGMKLPRRTEHNGEYIADIMKQKTAYVIRKQAGGASFEDGLRGMAEVLSAMAQKGG